MTTSYRPFPADPKTQTTLDPTEKADLIQRTEQLQALQAALSPFQRLGFQLQLKERASSLHQKQSQTNKGAELFDAREDQTRATPTEPSEVIAELESTVYAQPEGKEEALAANELTTGADAGRMEGEVDGKTISSQMDSLATPFQGIRMIGADFKNGTKMNNHFFDHGQEFGFETVEAYVDGARLFVAKEATATTQSFATEDGTYFRYDTETNEFGIINKYGGISTYFKPDNGLEYWLEQVEKYNRN